MQTTLLPTFNAIRVHAARGQTGRVMKNNIKITRKATKPHENTHSPTRLIRINEEKSNSSE